ncbi:transcription factor [Aeropyrum camini SY1 = JCM 12091]|uniref:TATA-box-binding protein n=1 Tax=Aeropyrum camini SY1 = JCM 12091 TaxID=1198449 RepID=U3TAV4_9CREN|nr:TATA-box-binding protein [Aeropyrum camini]BAN90637.1 transcription factor [Aeropyrum camini SY1 = JCM 12091]
MSEEISFVKEIDTGVEGLPKPEVKIENIVATVILENQLDLNLIETKIQDVDYNPDQFPGLVYRLESPRVTVLIFKSGKMVITGAKSINQLIHVVKKLLKAFADQGIPISGKPQIQIQNIVASANLKVYIDLEKAALEFENSLYEPEQFPGLIYRMDEPRVVMLIFSSGKMVITGAKMENEVYEAVKKVAKKLKEADAIIGIAE